MDGLCLHWKPWASCVLAGDQRLCGARVPDTEVAESLKWGSDLQAKQFEKNKMFLPKTVWVCLGNDWWCTFRWWRFHRYCSIEQLLSTGIQNAESNTLFNGMWCCYPRWISSWVDGGSAAIFASLPLAAFWPQAFVVIQHTHGHYQLHFKKKGMFLDVRKWIYIYIYIHTVIYSDKSWQASQRLH